MEPELVIRQQNATLELCLHRPARRNALTANLLGALHAALVRAASAAEIRAVILTGTPPAFCAGLDYDCVARMQVDATHNQQVMALLVDVLAAITDGGKPVIAAVDGPAVAGGAALLTACDLVFAGPRLRFGYPSVATGIVAAAIVPLLVDAVGRPRARYLLVTGALLDRAAAAAYGVVQCGVDEGEVIGAARECAARLASFPSAALARIKSLLAGGSAALTTARPVPPLEWFDGGAALTR